MTSKISIISNAFSLISLKSINSFDNNNELHITAQKLYDQLKPELLCMHPWRFAIDSKTLDKLVTPPKVSDYSSAFSFPANPTSILFFRPRPIVDFEIFGNEIYTNSNTLSMDYIYQPDEDKFPTYFTSALTYYLCAALALPGTQQFNLSEYFDKKAARQIAISQALDAQQYPNKAPIVDRLIAAHFIGNSI